MEPAPAQSYTTRQAVGGDDSSRGYIRYRTVGNIEHVTSNIIRCVLDWGSPVDRTIKATFHPHLESIPDQG